MKKFVLVAVLVFGSLGMSMNMAQAANCSPKAVTVNSQVSGVFSSLASARAIMQSNMNRLLRKWALAATNKYGARYSHMNRGTCKCTTTNKKLQLGDRINITCTLTANACDHPYVFMSNFRCEFR